MDKNLACQIIVNKDSHNENLYVYYFGVCRLMSNTKMFNGKIVKQCADCGGTLKDNQLRYSL